MAKQKWITRTMKVTTVEVTDLVDNRTFTTRVEGDVDCTKMMVELLNQTGRPHLVEYVSVVEETRRLKMEYFLELSEIIS